MSETLDFESALAALGRGEVGAVPTDTVYGLAASLDDEGAIAALFALKRRPPSVPTPVLVHSLEQVESLGVKVDSRTRALAAATQPARSLQSVWPDAKGALANLVDVALRFDRAQRWSSAEQMRRTLDGVLSLMIPAELQPAPAPTPQAAAPAPSPNGTA